MTQSEEAQDPFWTLACRAGDLLVNGIAVVDVIIPSFLSQLDQQNHYYSRPGESVNTDADIAAVVYSTSRLRQYYMYYYTCRCMYVQYMPATTRGTHLISGFLIHSRLVYVRTEYS